MYGISHGQPGVLGASWMMKNVITIVTDEWAELYLQQVKGVKPADPLLVEVRTLVWDGGRMAALRHVRQRAPRMSLQDVKAYVEAIRKGNEPSEHLASLTREQPKGPPLLGIKTLAGPCDENREPKSS
ncbi:hypothetical protein [Rugosimonospora africana]|uniref:Uncharacterized protein n=1 Tax=Rugosimonospora africana TaxID=556532 RepID=A0A8J3VWC2_9ACTN|nr:hypothetical protein [Rugosimonospora africana]GIH21175.1 hypothetical protein Raf01_93470 [Rugosimonospora africana]